MEFEQFAECMECGWHNKADYCEDIEVMYHSHDSNWRHEKVCPVCGSAFLRVTLEEK